MTIKSSGSLSFFYDIVEEFGFPPGRNLGAYKVSQTVSGLTDMPLDAGIPQSGPIKFSHFYSKKLNIVVDCTPAPNTVATRVNAKSNYDANSNITVIGGFVAKPASPTNKKVWIHTNGAIGSDQKSSQTYCSLLTGSWDATTDLYIDIGTSGAVYGAGGNGGKGGGYGSNPVNGGNGTSAIGINPTNNVVFSNRGSIVAGGGGGGGGGKGLYTRKGRQSNGYGGGGGGGNGYPVGNGGAKGDGSATAGGNGTLTTGGNGGNGSVDGQTSSGASGGGGGGGGAFGGTKGTGAGTPYGNGSPGDDSTSTNGGNGGSAYNGGGGGSGGANGYAIITTGGTLTVSGTGTVIGSQLANASGGNAPS